MAAATAGRESARGSERGTETETEIAAETAPESMNETETTTKIGIANVGAGRLSSLFLHPCFQLQLLILTSH